ncbi:hypothetical protein CRG98_038226 [Punica granatum]|uniref:Uncharacterized protein n=1 Tax=Punica granatum TaxID=22663 RepID=A0A2I0ICC6_PUNGR|nr:hypothetical protein CRG98_038226 [Punica granatum]
MAKPITGAEEGRDARVEKEIQYRGFHLLIFGELSFAWTSFGNFVTKLDLLQRLSIPSWQLKRSTTGFKHMKRPDIRSCHTHRLLASLNAPRINFISILMLPSNPQAPGQGVAAINTKGSLFMLGPSKTLLETAFKANFLLQEKPLSVR